jgi:imidazolonepropionase-like amidohydrolase
MYGSNLQGEVQEVMTTALLGAQVFVGDERVFERGTVLVEDERILKVSKGSDTVPRDATKVDLSGFTLLPGFIDCHVHLCLDGSPDPMGAIEREPAPLTILKAAEGARKALSGGVTTVRDMGGKEQIDLVLRDAIRAGRIPGPRMLASGRVICMTGGHGWQMGREADGPDEVRKAAREQIKAGADIVKLMATGGVMTPGVEPGSEQYTEEELRAGVQEAHNAGKKTATHAMGTRGILNALRAGIDSVEHGVFLNEEAITWMVKHDIPFIPTISALYNIEHNGVEAGIPAFAVEKTLRVKPYFLDSIQMAKEAGVRVAMGTDAGTPFNLHGNNLGELKCLVDMGFSPIEALRSGTQVAARVLGREEELGTISEGKLADIIAVEGNPLEEIDLLLNPERIRFVMQGGRMVKEG